MHNPVLLREVIKYLDPKPGEDFIDATVGDGSHARAILERIGSNGRLLGIDLDPTSLRLASELRRASLGSPNPITKGPRCDTGSMVRESEPPRTDLLNQQDRSGIALRPLESGRFDLPGRSNLQLVLKQGNFADIVEVARRAGFEKISGALFDLGLRSEQIDDTGYGFSYRADGPLDMRFDRSNKSNGTNKTRDLTAADIVNEWPESELARIFKEYGEERNAKRIARAVIIARSRKRIETTGELVEIVTKSYRTNVSNKTNIKVLARVFQALRIAVNNELENLKKGLTGAWSLLKPQGRLAVISFHSLEDRIVKNFFKDRAQIGQGKILTPKPVCPNPTEIKANPRSRSAKLRAIAKIKNKI